MPLPAAAKMHAEAIHPAAANDPAYAWAGPGWTIRIIIVSFGCSFIISASAGIPIIGLPGMPLGMSCIQLWGCVQSSSPSRYFICITSFPQKNLPVEGGSIRTRYGFYVTCVPPTTIPPPLVREQDRFWWKAHVTIGVYLNKTSRKASNVYGTIHS